MGHLGSYAELSLLFYLTSLPDRDNLGVVKTRFILVYKITGILRALWLVNRVAKPKFYCTGKHIEKWLRQRWER